MIYVIIVTYNGATWIRRCLDSLANNSKPLHTIVIDNNSSDDTLAIVETEYPQVQLQKCPINLGFGVANNIGISLAIRAGAEYIVLLNQDAYVLPNTINQMQEFMFAHSEFGVCSPIHCSPNSEEIDKKTFNNYFIKYGADFLCDAILGRRRGHYTIHGVNAAFWFVRRDAFLTAGGFDPIFFMYGEDDDLLRRFAFHGIKFALLPNLRFVHLRQSPSTPAKGSLDAIQRLRSRRCAQLLVSLKNPKHSNLHALTSLLSKGFLNPIADFPLNRNWRQLIGNLLAAASVVRHFPTISRHRKILRSVGPCFLNLPTTPNQTETRNLMR